MVKEEEDGEGRRGWCRDKRGGGKRVEEKDVEERTG